MTHPPILPFRKQIAYSFGMLGWSIMINVISVILIYLYIPPSNSSLPILISQATIFGVFNIIAILAASGRLVDAIYDPFIAQFSDKSTNKKGRRIPIMKMAIIPSMIFCFLVFYPLVQKESSLNTIWLMLMLVLFYISSTSFIIPYNALLPELAPTSELKVRFTTFQSIGYVVGIGVSSNAFNICNWIQQTYQITNRIIALQITVLILVLFAALCMAITVFSIDEKKYCISKPSSVPLLAALKQAFSNKSFLLFITADFSYYVAITIITSGLMYFLTVLLKLPETMGNKLIITMVLVSFIFYPIINILAKRFKKKVIIIISLIILSLVFLGICFLGKGTIHPETQIYLLIFFAAIPLASLNIIPNALLAEIIEKDSIETGSNKEGIYFAVRYLFVKIAQTFGIGFFAMLLIYGKEIGNDAGIRYNGILGFVLCLSAALIFTRFKEKKPNNITN